MAGASFQMLIGQSWAFPGGGGPTDPYFSSVKLLMGFEGTNGSTGSPGMTDESSAAHGTATVETGASISTAQFKAGASSLFIDSSSVSSSIRFSPSSDWTFGAGHFTIEMFIRPHVLNVQQFLCSQWSVFDGNNAFAFYIATSNKLRWDMTATGSGGATVGMTGTTNLVADAAQYHACVDYDGSKYRLYLNGVMEGSYSTPITIHDTSGGLALNMGSALAGFNAAGYTGYMDELRITKGVARYASDAGFTVPTVPFPRS
jgi:hypothetical protein